MSDIAIKEKTCCAHCGDDCDDHVVKWEGQLFCCVGCKSVYQILSDHDMGQYYKLELTPGKRPNTWDNDEWAFLDDDKVINRLLDFNEGEEARITLTLPQIHCSSCLWLLERIHQLEKGVHASHVNFLSKEVAIRYNTQETSLRKIVSLLSAIGYKPELNLGKLEKGKSIGNHSKSLLYKLGLAGFAFGNIMLLSFPEYLGLQRGGLSTYVGYINILLALPVLSYSGIDYLRSALVSLRYRATNIDVPIALGMLTLFCRSVYDIVTATGEGYLDSLTGFIFFLLIGKWFQQFTYRSLDFNRNYKSYFPIATLKKYGDKWKSTSLDRLRPGDHILIKNEQIIPADAQVISGQGLIDYSFVTGESDTISKKAEDIVYAGGRQKGGSIELKVLKEVAQSYLTQLWNEHTFRNQSTSDSGQLITLISRYFTGVILVVALSTFIYWIGIDKSVAFNAFTSVLIVACPCALALSVPFTYGNMLRILSSKECYLRNVQTIEYIQDIDHIVFDKTGTLTDHRKLAPRLEGMSLSSLEKSWVKSLAFQSTHPLSKAIYQLYPDVEVLPVTCVKEEVGLGIQGKVGGSDIKLGSVHYIFGDDVEAPEKGVFVSINNAYRGVYKYEDELRAHIQGTLDQLSRSYELSVLSGDSDKHKERIEALFPEGSIILFEQSPKDKLDYIKDLQNNGKRVMMIGDGLNDAGALSQGNVGIVVADDDNNFTPASDAIISPHAFSNLIQHLRYIHAARWAIYGAFCLAFIYNIAGLYFATTGKLAPVVAAILMPLSSITIIVYGVATSFLLAWHILKLKK